jgi:urease accessory protein
MCSSPPAENLQGIGKEGILRLNFEKREHRTVLSESFSRMPMQAFPPFYPDETGCAYAYLVNPTGGLVGGDRIEIKIELQEHAHAFITTPSATKIYRSLGPFAYQEIRVALKKQAIFEYIPQYIIPFAKSRYFQKTKIFMEKNSTVLFLDFLTTGRLARGEHLQFEEYRSYWEVEYCGELILTDRFSLKPLDTDYSSLGFLECFSAAAVLYMVFDNPSLEAPLIDDLRQVIQRMKNIVGGVSLLPSKGIIVRLLGNSTNFIEKTVFQIWSVARRQILSLEPCSSMARLVPS